MRKPLTVEKRRDGMLMVKISTAGTTPIPVVLLMRALGIDNDQEIFTAIAGPTETFKYIVANINEVNDNEEYAVQNMLEAHEWLQKKFAAGQQKDYREARVDQLLDRELLPHLGDQGTDRKKKLHRWLEVNLISKLVTCTQHIGEDCARTKLQKVKIVD